MSEISRYCATSYRSHMGPCMGSAIGAQIPCTGILHAGRPAHPDPQPRNLHDLRPTPCTPADPTPIPPACLPGPTCLPARSHLPACPIPPACLPDPTCLPARTGLQSADRGGLQGPALRQGGRVGTAACRDQPVAGGADACPVTACIPGGGGAGAESAGAAGSRHQQVRDKRGVGGRCRHGDLQTPTFQFENAAGGRGGLPFSLIPPQYPVLPPTIPLAGLRSGMPSCPPPPPPATPLGRRRYTCGRSWRVSRQ